MTDTDQIFPPIVPNEDEVVLAADPSFETECMAAISDAAREWRFGSSLLTTSDKWGLVWRADFTAPPVSASADFINRVTCWRSAEETGKDLSGISIAYGQRVRPL